MDWDLTGEEWIRDEILVELRRLGLSAAAIMRPNVFSNTSATVASDLEL